MMSAIFWSWFVANVPSIACCLVALDDLFPGAVFIRPLYDARSPCIVVGLWFLRAAVVLAGADPLIVSTGAFASGLLSTWGANVGTFRPRNLSGPQIADRQARIARLQAAAEPLYGVDTARQLAQFTDIGTGPPQLKGLWMIKAPHIPWDSCSLQTDRFHVAQLVAGQLAWLFGCSTTVLPAMEVSQRGMQGLRMLDGLMQPQQQQQGEQQQTQMAPQQPQHQQQNQDQHEEWQTRMTSQQQQQQQQTPTDSPDQQLLQPSMDADSGISNYQHADIDVLDATTAEGDSTVAATSSAPPLPPPAIAQQVPAIPDPVTVVSALQPQHVHLVHQMLQKVQIVVVMLVHSTGVLHAQVRSSPGPEACPITSRRTAYTSLCLMMQAWETLEAFNSVGIRVVVHLQAGLDPDDPELPGCAFVRSHLMEDLCSLQTSSSSSRQDVMSWCVNSRWGDVSLARAMAHGAGYAAEHFPNATAIVYASGSDLPLLVSTRQISSSIALFCVLRRGSSTSFCLQTEDKAAELLKAVRGGRVLWPEMYPGGNDNWLQEALKEAADALGPGQRTDAVLLRAMVPHARAHHQWFVLSREAGLLLWTHRASVLRMLEIACDTLPRCVLDFSLAADEMLLVALAAWGDALGRPLSVHNTITAATTLVSFPPKTAQAAGMARWLLGTRHPPPQRRRNAVELLEKYPDAGSRPLRQPLIVTDLPHAAKCSGADLELVRRLAQHAEAEGLSPTPISGGFSVYTVSEVVRALACTVRQCAADADAGGIPSMCTAHPITWSSATQLYVWVDVDDTGVCGSLNAMVQQARKDSAERKNLVVAVRKVAEGVTV